MLEVPSDNWLGRALNTLSMAYGYAVIYASDSILDKFFPSLSRFVVDFFHLNAMSIPKIMNYDGFECVHLNTYSSISFVPRFRK